MPGPFQDNRQRHTQESASRLATPMPALCLARQSLNGSPVLCETGGTTMTAIHHHHPIEYVLATIIFLLALLLSATMAL